ncbi:MAG: type IV secretory system conjugative DNA transfer family protein [Nitrososphaera sp.]
MSSTSSIIPKRGERALIAGQTGSGKTYFAVWLLEKLGKGLIFDTKIEPKFSRLGPVTERVGAALKLKKENPFVVLRPPSELLADPGLLDDMLVETYERMRGGVVYVDEAYQFHKGAAAGPGLIGLLTRGRSRGITTVLSTQRPVWLSRFALTETQRYYVFNLADRRDRSTLGQVIPDFERATLPGKHHFLYYDSGSSEGGIRTFAPVALPIDAAYTDKAVSHHWV